MSGSPLHRLEHALLAGALLVACGWLVATGATDLWRILVWALAPDVVLLPIALAARRGPWPPWGAPLYNATHTYLVLVPAFVVASLLQGHVVWPLVAWALHLEVDRALGFDLRR